MIGIIITTIDRDELLYKSIQSLLNNCTIPCKIIIIDQTPTNDKLHYFAEENIYYFGIPYNSGLSYARNFGVERAKELECDYILIGSDSFLFTKSINWLDIFTKELGIYKLTNMHNFDLIGFELKGCICDWEAKLNLIQGQSFELDFINKDGWEFWSLFFPIHSRIYRCDIVRNFFLATTESLLKVKWDNNLKLCEHEDFFYRYKQANYYVGWTNSIYATKMTDRPENYSQLRKQNFAEGQKYLKEKYQIKGWVTYKNLERAKHG